MEISIYIGVTIREIRHTHLVMHTFLQRGACQVLFIVTGINTIKCTAYIEPVREAIKQRYNIIVEGTFRTADTPIKTLKDMKVAGYKTIVKVKAVNADVAWQSTIDRFNDMKSMGLDPRAVNKLVFDKTVNGLAEKYI